MAEVLLGPIIIKRRLPADSGGGCVVASGRVGGLKYLLRASRHLDPELLAIAAILVKKGHSVWDVGANVGLFSKAAAFHAGREGAVLSIEPDVDAVALLHRTCRYRSAAHADITVLPVVVSESIGFVRFDIAKRARAANSIQGFGSTQTGGVKESRTLPSFTLDSMLGTFRTPDVLKIDVEGSEIKVLEGAERLLIGPKPLIYCEVTAQTGPAVAQLLERHGYRVWDGCGFDGSSRSSSVSLATINVVALPEQTATTLP